MELSRQEYPGIVNSVQPIPATKLIRERLQKGQALSQEIADWLQERRRAEEAYIQALNKLCRRPQPGEASELGVFTGPWHRIVESTIRLDNFEVLEKVAPNPAFLSALPGKMGEYKVALSSIRKTVVALKYQVHVDQTNSATFFPIVVSATWRLEPHQSSVILSWKPNPDFRFPSVSNEPTTLRNVMFVIGIEGAHASSCQSKPVGTFSRDKGRIMWKMETILVDPRKPEEGGKMLARFATEGQARACPAEVRWEVAESGGMGSSLGLSMELKKADNADDDADPFADEDEKETSEEETGGEKTKWENVKTTRKLMSGKYISS